MRRGAIKYIILLAVTLLISTALAFEINGDGTPVDFAKMGLTARYWGMGKAGLAGTNDAGGMLLNPASLGVARSFEMTSMSTKLLGEFNYLMLNMVYPLEKDTLGLSLLMEDAGTITGSDELDQYGHPLQGENIENYTRMLSLGYGRKLFFDNLYFGVVAKLLNKRIAFVDANSNSVDVGLIYKFNKFLSLGAALKNAAQSDYTYSNNSADPEHLKQDYVFGASLSLLDNNLLFSVDRHNDLDFIRTNFGAEYWLLDTVAFRAGVEEKNTTLGIGFRYKSLQIDYALRYQEAPLENESYISITYGDATRAHLRQPEIEIVSKADLVAEKESESLPKIETINVREQQHFLYEPTRENLPESAVKIKQVEDDEVVEII